MPITLGCPSCGKRFRARDESAGKRVKCPYCAAAVSVPTAEEAAAAGAPTAPLSPPSPPPPPPKPGPRSGPAAAPSGPASVATPEDWGAGAPPASPPPAPNPFSGGDTTSAPPAPLPLPTRGKPAPKPAAKPARQPATPKTPEQLAAAGWKKTRAGLGCVLFGLFWLTIPGFVGFGKMVYERSVDKLPQGDGWVSIPGYVNDPNTVGAVKMTKVDQLDVALYAIPVVLGGLCLGFGRLTAGAAPRSSGASGLFAFSGLFTLLALASLVTAAASDKLLFRETYLYTALGFLILAALAEFWFLTGLAASGAALKRPGVSRAVGLIGFFAALAAAVPTLGWMVYYREWRPKPPDEDWKLYEQAALMIGWLLMIGVYWRAVRGVRAAISDHLEGVEE
jgi:hypothetical protein